MNTKGLTTDEDMRNCILQGSRVLAAGRVAPEDATYKGITFKLPQVSDGNDLLVARGETLELPRAAPSCTFWQPAPPVTGRRNSPPIGAPRP